MPRISCRGVGHAGIRGVGNVGREMMTTQPDPDPWSRFVTPEMEAAVDAILAKAPPLTPERVRDVLAAFGVEVEEFSQPK
jgi:2-keto-4-pentenoate hydratase